MATIPKAKPGLVIRYQYLWQWQALDGRTTGEKDRPACLILAPTGFERSRRVLILPITHTPPPTGILSFLMPQRLKEHLHLDEDLSWVILSEANIDIWPSPDCVPIGSLGGEFIYGVLPEKLTRQFHKVMLEAILEHKFALSDRESEQPGTESDLEEIKAQLEKSSGGWIPPGM